MTDEHDQPAPYRRLSPLTPLVRAPLLVLAFLGGSWQQLLSGHDLGARAVVLTGLLAAGAAYGVASWLRTRYRVTGSELRIDTGVLSRRSRRIRIDRLQGVDIVQPAVARLFGLAELRFDAASGAEREGSLAFLPLAEARRLRRLLLDRREGLLTSGPGGAVTAEGLPTARDAERVLAVLDLRRLLVGTVLSTEALWGLAGTAALAVTFFVTGSFAAAGGLVPAVLAVAVAGWRRLAGSYGLQLSESAAGLQVRRGLTSLSSQTIARRRIQGFKVAEPLLWRPLGWARLEVSVAGYREDDGDRPAASSVLMPVAPLQEVLGLVHHVLGRDVREVALVPAPARARWRSPLRARTLALGQDDRLVVSRRGWWVRRLDVAPQERVVSARLAQGPWQRVLRLADVELDSPAGTVQVRGALRGADEARDFLDRHLRLAAARRLTG